MTKLSQGVGSLIPGATTLGVGDRALQVSRQLAGARRRLSTKALFRFDVELAGFIAATDPDPWRVDAPVPDAVLHHARDFLRTLPGTLPEPRVCRDTDGGLTFEWAGQNARSLKVKIGADGMLVYAARLGLRRRINGAEPLGDELPTIIRTAIQQVAC